MNFVVTMMTADFAMTDACDTLNECQRERELGKWFQDEGESTGYADDATWIMTASFVIFTMQTGFGLLEMGSCQAGHEVNILLKNVVDVAFGSLAYYLFGYGIAFGTPSTPFMGLGQFVPTGGIDSTLSGLVFSRYIFQLSFAATSTTIVSGCVVMRMKFFVYCAYSFFSVIAYAFVAHWAWAEDGWLFTLGFHDFAGGGPVHLFGGISGLVGILFLGPRTGRFDGSRPETDFLPVSPVSMVFGLFMLWWGWIGFNCGSTFGVTDDRWVTATRAAITTINSSSAGAFVGIASSMIRTKAKLVKPEDIVNGILGALVAITPCCDSVHTYAAFVIGAIGGLVANWINHSLLPRLKIDDPVGAIGVHVGAGIWGLLAVGLFSDSNLPATTANDGLFYGGGFRSLGIQLLGITTIMGWGIAFSVSFFYVVGVLLSGDTKDPRKGLRVPLIEEMRGADWYLHGVEDWQQDLKTSTRLDENDNNNVRFSSSERGRTNKNMHRRVSRRSSGWPLSSSPSVVRFDDDAAAELDAAADVDDNDWDDIDEEPAAAEVETHR